MRLCILIAALLTLSPTVRADDNADEARKLYNRGQIEFALGNFNKAAAFFQQSFQASQRPALLYNIAKAYRKQYEIDHDPAGLRRARQLYSSYMELVTNDEERADARREQATVEAEIKIAEERRPADAPPDAPKVAPQQVVVPERATSPSLEVHDETRLIAIEASPKPTEQPVYRRWWFWTAAVGIVAVVAIALSVGLGASGGGNAPPMTNGGDFSPGFH